MANIDNEEMQKAIQKDIARKNKKYKVKEETILKETNYCYLLKQSRLDVKDDEYSYMIEKIKVKEHDNREEIRFSIYKDIVGKGEKLVVRPMDLQENLLLILLEKAIKEDIFSKEFTDGLKAIIEKI